MGQRRQQVSNIVHPKVVVTGRIPDAGLDIIRSIEGSDVWAWLDDDVVPVEVRNEQLADADAAVTLLTDRVDAEFLAARSYCCDSGCRHCPYVLDQ